jgi:hypothetical protein
VDATTFLWFRLLMAGLKTFLYAVAPMLGTTGATLYERQRALVAMGAIKAAEGRGPGSGAPLTAENFAAVLISLLATTNLSEVDKRVTALFAAKLRKPAPQHVKHHVGTAMRRPMPTFLSEVALMLGGKPSELIGSKKNLRGIRVSRFWRGQLAHGADVIQTDDFIVDGSDRTPINITAEIERDVLEHLITFLRGALSQADEEEDEE